MWFVVRSLVNQVKKERKFLAWSATEKPLPRLARTERPCPAPPPSSTHDSLPLRPPGPASWPPASYSSPPSLVLNCSLSSSASTEAPRPTHTAQIICSLSSNFVFSISFILAKLTLVCYIEGDVFANVHDIKIIQCYQKKEETQGATTSWSSC